jgi:hypothetical protein
VNARPTDRRAALPLAAATVAIRLFVLAIWPHHAYSCDLRDWQIVGGGLLVGINPYVGYRLLNWPPMWMEVLFVLSRLCDLFDWWIINAIRLLLIACDALMILTLWRLLGLLNARDRAFKPILWGLVLNPFMILLTIQQGNFDVIPEIMILWFLFWLIRFRRSQNSMDWLMAALFLGLGGFAKTFPLALSPLLIGESRKLDVKTRLLGIGLCFAPAPLSLAPLYVISPGEIYAKVISYRGTQGNVGVSGILQYFDGIRALKWYAPYFTAATLVVLILITLRLWWRPMRKDGNLVLLSALMLLGLFEFGTGYCPQYWMWVAPLLCIAYIQNGRAFKIVAAATAIVVAVIQILVFAYNRDLGFFASYMLPGPFTDRMGHLFTDISPHLTYIGLPITVMTLLLWIAGVTSLLSHDTES